MMRDVDSALQSLRDAGLRVTAQRRAIVEELVGDTSHPSAEEVAARVSARLPEVSLSTVYKILHELVGLGMVRQLRSGATMRFDPDSADHAHLTCATCGRIVDVAVDAAADAVRSAVAAAGHQAAHVDIALVGLCSRCAKNPMPRRDTVA